MRVAIITEVDRTETYRRRLAGELALAADARRGILVGASAVGPLAGEWIHLVVIAIKARGRARRRSIRTIAPRRSPTFSCRSTA
jgi:pyruvate/2-oxoglutarate dehydrogenase complex dihydrolipoamide dehydrogenase (E3) component